MNEILDAYPNEVNRIKDAIKRNHNNLTQDEFDSEFGDYRVEMQKDGNLIRTRNVPDRLWFLGGDFLIGSFAQSFSYWSKWLHLTQIMVAEGTLDVEEEDGKLAYSLVDGAVECGDPSCDDDCGLHHL
jgi:hypothetical protein